MRTSPLFLFLIISINSLSLGHAQDWRQFANLERYHSANQALAMPTTADKRVVFMGNSITEAWSVKSPAFFKENGYINRGISGQTTPQMLLRFRSDVIDLKPKVVVILAGTNDIAGNTGYSSIEAIAGNIFSMAELARQNGIQVILSAVLPAIDYPWTPGKEPADKIRSLNALLQTYAEKHNYPFVDYYSAIVDDNGGLKVPEYTTAEDLVHPNAAGYQVMEKLVQPAIKIALAN